MRDNTLPEDSFLAEQFCVNQKLDGEFQVVDLVDDGRTIDVTNDNKDEFIKLL